MKITILLMMVLFFEANRYSTCSLNSLKCEYLSNPIGLDAAHPRLSWKIQNGIKDIQQIVYTITVSSDSLGVVENTKGNVEWHIVQHSSEQRATYNGKPLRPFTRYYWKVTITDQRGKNISSAISSFETGMMGQANWKCNWITDTKDVDLGPAAYYRRQFLIGKTIRSARAYIAVAGLYELYLNGKKIGDHFLDPMYTRFDRRNLYVTYDVTKQLQQGANAIGVLLGNGWYNFQSATTWYFNEAPWRARPSFCMDLRIIYTDDTTETISTDKKWKTALSDVTSNSIYRGEHTDDNKAIPNWNRVNLDDRKWKPAIITGTPSQHIVSQMLYPIRVGKAITPVSCNKLNDTDYVYDLGRNISGFSRISLKGDSGTVIKLKHAEKLYTNGHADISNIDVDFFYPASSDDLLVTDIYTLSGKGVEIFQPEFSYKGFRYVEVTGNKPVDINQNSVTAFFTHSDVPQVGIISCSDSTINRLWRATNNSYLANLQGYPTDCPQREKNGWTGDAHMAIEAGLFNYDAITIYEKWLADIRDEQNPNGLFPGIVPSAGWGYEHYNTVDWLSCLVILPWELYRFYGDKTALEQNYAAMKRYIDYLDDTHPDGLIPEGLGDREAINHHASVELTSTCYYYNDAVILTRAATLFQKKADEEKYSKLAQKIKTAFNKKYYDPIDKSYGQGYQTENSMALYWGLVPDDKKAEVAQSLAKSVTTDSLHLDIGILGNVAILNALSQNGYTDIAYKLITKDTYPSWGYWMKQGMTTLPETWNMSTSLNHIFMGEISAWLYKGLGGINIDEQQPGFKHIILQPYIPAGLDQFEAQHESPYGMIRSGWRTKDGKIIYSVTIPTGSMADLKLNMDGHVIKTAKLNPGNYSYTMQLTQ